tara:strand:+ start:12327 stop:13247 length:921 start_codon:yes stop_codon:yes gene_type:complete
VGDILNLIRIGLGTQFLLVVVFSSAILTSPIASSQAISCDVPPSSDWGDGYDPKDYLSVGSTKFGTLFESNDDDRGGAPVHRALDRDLSTEWSGGAWSGFPGVRVDNGTATYISMVLEPGKRYSFCIDLETQGDVYLLTESDFGVYNADYSCREGGDTWGVICDLEAFQEVPMEYRDLFTWIPFRDTHAYESVTYQEFSVAIDSSGSSWTFAGFSPPEDKVFYLVLDNWNNSRPGDSLPSGNMSVEVLIDVEDRRTLPKVTAYFLVGSLPLSCIIIPLLLHWKYHSYSKEEETGGIAEVPYLRDDV